jgi:hypothetical protein
MASTDVYELALYCAPLASTLTFQLIRLTTGDVARGTIGAAASLPASSQLLGNQLWRSNGATAAPCALDFFSMYVETEI